MPAQRTHGNEVLVLGDENCTNGDSIRPNTLVSGPQQSNVADMLGLVADRGQMTRKCRRQLRVDKKAHGYICSRMILSENRFPLFGIMRYAERMTG